MTNNTGTPPGERNERLDGPIHPWFGLSYSNYLVLCRSMMQSMPVEWQERAVALFDELDNAFPDLGRAPSYIVQPAEERTYGDLSSADRKRLGVTCALEDPASPEDHDGVFHDSDGHEYQSSDVILVPVGEDPVPHYNRGRTFIESTAGATS